MIPKECKRLAEVDFPIAVVSKHAAREKSIRHGHPSTLHLWWARRPLAACRAMLLGLLLPDPSDNYCPEEFKQKARGLLPKVQGQVGPEDEDVRKSLLKFIGDFANWDLSADPTYLEVSRGLVKAANPEQTPFVVDPFAGGGSIPLEALRLGCETFASDLNPIACLILKVMLEDIPRHGQKLAEELRRVGDKLQADAEKALAKFYPPNSDGGRAVAYLWARTVRCEQPKCGAEIPLLRSFWLCTRASNKAAIRCIVKRKSSRPPEIVFEIFTPEHPAEVRRGTVVKGRATCVACGAALAPDRVKAQLSKEYGGANPILDKQSNRIGGARLLAVIEHHENGQTKSYRLPTSNDYAGVRRAILESPELQAELAQVPLPAPRSKSSSIPANFSFMPIRLYGLRGWGDIFSARQQLALSIVAKEVAKNADSLAVAALTCVLGRCVDYWSANALWAQEGEFVAHTFGRHALPMVWDFAEAVPFAGGSGSFESALGWVERVVNALACCKAAGQTQLGDASESPLPDSSASLWFTDPPYYDAVPYAYLSDFFLIWIKRALLGASFLSDPFDSTNPLSPKKQEIIDDFDLFRGAPKEKAKSLGFILKDREFFEKAMAKCFAEGKRVLNEQLRTQNN